MESVNMFKAGFVRHGEDNQEAVSRPHVLLPHCTELLLTSCVQHCAHIDTNAFIHTAGSQGSLHTRI